MIVVVAFIGRPVSGKTHFANFCTGNVNSGEYHPTVGFAYHVITVTESVFEYLSCHGALLKGQCYVLMDMAGDVRGYNPTRHYKDITIAVIFVRSDGDPKDLKVFLDELKDENMRRRAEKRAPILFLYVLDYLPRLKSKTWEMVKMRQKYSNCCSWSLLPEVRIKFMTLILCCYRKQIPACALMIQEYYRHYLIKSVPIPSANLATLLTKAVIAMSHRNRALKK